jgi:hypothetical protein
MNVVRNSVGFDADRLFTTGSRQSIGGAGAQLLPVDFEGMSTPESNTIGLGGFSFYKNPPTGEMTVQKMDLLARQRLGRMLLFFFPTINHSASND